MISSPRMCGRRRGSGGLGGSVAGVVEAGERGIVVLMAQPTVSVSGPWASLEPSAFSGQPPNRLPRLGTAGDSSLARWYIE